MFKFTDRLMRAAGRVFPGCIVQSQAVAFNMFLAFFPMLLLALAVLDSAVWLKGSDEELPTLLRLIIPSGSERIVLDYLVRKGIHPWQWMTLGLGGTLIAGSQVMSVLMEGFRKISGDTENPGFFARQSRALVLLSVTMAPWLAVVVLTVFGRQLREWLILQYGWMTVLRAAGVVFYVAMVMALAFCVLSAIYLIGRPRRQRWSHVAPGALLATVLWWLVDVSLGTYFRYVPYSVVYGGLAAAIGLLLWMYLSAIVLFMGAAYNMEAEGFRHGLFSSHRENPDDQFTG